MPKVPASKFFPLFAHGDGTRRSYPESLPGLTINASVRDAVERINAAAGNGAITPSLVVEYVDTSGVRQTRTVAADGSTSITGVAPFLVHFDATGTRSVVTTGDSEPEAYNNIGYRLNSGEAIGGTWTYGGRSRDEDTGPPIFGRVYTQTGTFTARLRCRDSESNESTRSFTVVVTAPPTAALITVASGSWPTFTSGSHYSLEAGGNYTSFGQLSCDALHNILFSKSGSGADPIISTFQPDSRNNVDSVITAARNIRIQDIDCASFTPSNVGFQYCGAVRGRVRRSFPPSYSDGSNATQRNNHRYPRGMFLWDTGEMNPDVGEQYVWLTAGRHVHLAGVVMHKNGAAGNHTVRSLHHKSSMRHCNFYATVAVVTHFKQQALEVTAGDGQPDSWEINDDRVRPSDGSRKYGYPNSYFVLHSNQFDRAGTTLADNAVAIAPQFDDTPAPDEGHEFNALEDCIAANANFNNQNPNVVDLGGRYLSVRNVRMSMGTGTYATLGNGSKNSNNIPPGWNNPGSVNLVESVNTRPVPTAF